MFDKFLKKVGDMKDDLIQEVAKNPGDALNNIINNEVNKKKTDVFSSVFDKVSDAVTSGAGYLVQVEKMANEKRAQDLGLSSRQLLSMTTEEIASRYGLTVEEYQEKLQREASKYENTNYANSVKEVRERSKIEAEARQDQAAKLNISLEEFDQLTLQEQAERLNMTLENLLKERALDF